MPGQLVILKVEPASPADEAGLVPNMIVLFINGSSTLNKTVPDVKPFIFGKFFIC